MLLLSHYVKLGHYIQTSIRGKKTQNKTKLINHLFHCWINKLKLAFPNCQAEMVSAELHIRFNELNSQERRCSIQTAQKWLMYNWWVTQCREFYVRAGCYHLEPQCKCAAGSDIREVCSHDSSPESVPRPMQRLVCIWLHLSSVIYGTVATSNNNTFWHLKD